MISSTSRYTKEPVSVVTDERGTHQSINVQTPADTSFSFTSYMVQEGDTIDWLASNELGDGTLWWILSDANPEILDWHHLEPGTVLRIPHV